LVDHFGPVVAPFEGLVAQVGPLKRVVVRQLACSATLEATTVIARVELGASAEEEASVGEPFVVEAFPVVGAFSLLEVFNLGLVGHQVLR